MFHVAPTSSTRLKNDHAVVSICISTITYTAGALRVILILRAAASLSTGMVSLRLRGKNCYRTCPKQCQSTVTSSNLQSNLGIWYASCTVFLPTYQLECTADILPAFK